MDPSALVKELEAVLNGEGGGEPLQSALEAIARAFGAVTATLHRADPSARALALAASFGLPEKVLAIVRTVPFGKGMAGLCAERREPVTVCNLQTDQSGCARPGARATGAGGSVVVPVFAAGNGELAGTLGIGKPGEHSFSEEEMRTLDRCARVLAARLGSPLPRGA